MSADHQRRKSARPDAPCIDYRAVYLVLPAMIALLTPELVYCDVNDAYEHNSGRSRQELIGRYVFDVFPDNPHDPATKGARDLKTSLERVLSSKRPETMALQRYDVESTDRTGRWRTRYWSTINIPVLDDDGRVLLLVHRVEEVTELFYRRGRTDGDESGVLEADVYNRSQELHEANEELRQAHARERAVALALQDAMLPVPHMADARRAAVRYRPAINALNVCGDWYDLIDLPDGSIAATVGDVVGHGLTAAGVMGQLRSALSSAALVSAGPAQALQALSLYARSVAGAESTTAACVRIDPPARRLAYSSAGHLPPALVHGDGTVEFLDEATDPPLGAGPEDAPRPEAHREFAPGDTLVLYTDGLIERRSESITTSLERLATSLETRRNLEPEQLADALLSDLLPETGADDDTALVVIRL